MVDPVLAQATAEDLAVIAEGVNLLWVLVVTFLIFFMHAGFAMLEAGQVRSKNVANQLTKNLLTWSVGVLAFFFVGAGLSGIVGAATSGGSFALADLFGTMTGSDPNAWVDWLFGAVFAMTAATIVSGAVAGRAKLRAYVGYTLLLAAVIYPVVTGFTWGEGFLFELGFSDFAGGMIVHGMGGIAGLTAAYVIGPRMDRFNDDGSVNVIPGHSMTFAVLGTLVLAFGWYGFNVGTAATVFAVEEGIIGLAAFASVGRVALATTVGMAAGALGAAAVTLYRTGKVDTLYVANGLLAGLVGVTGIADLVSWWGAIAAGLLAGAQLPLVFSFVEKRLGIDDVCAVFPVHGSAGVLGVLLLPLVHHEGLALDLVVPQVTGVLVITVWTVAATGVVFGLFRAAGQARVSADHEREGLDAAEHGVDTYPEFGGPEVPDGSAVRADGGEETLRTDEVSASGGSSELRSDGGSASGTSGTSSELRSDGGLPNDGGIKMVTAIVRPDSLTAIKTALAEVGAPSLTVTNVSGRGSQPQKTGQWRGEEYVVDLHQKVKVECVVADVPADDVVAAIREAAATGEPGDGKVFVMPVEDAVQVRTGKRGREAV